MTHFGFQLPDEIAEQFDAYAAMHGGRSAVLRALVAQCLSSETALPQRPAPEPVSHAQTSSVPVLLTRDDRRRLDEECRITGMTRGQWLAACARNRLHGTRHFGQVDRDRIARITREMREMKSSLHRYACAMQRAPRDLAVVEKHQSLIGHLSAQVERGLRAIEGAFRGNDHYWSGQPAEPRPAEDRRVAPAASAAEASL
ncbi:hypothetical protein [Caulobacter endophyticus]|uniref:hypothetical protein n=1 Tax=Caulobacter endophyticus TaxID=2172652 RepID=UPI00240F06E8|nr:hypothetical protein [Caulobacter endophyticus]MDG2531383.1 hypothetical protein [Caulobacter endophyticus]